MRAGQILVKKKREIRHKWREKGGKTQTGGSGDTNRMWKVEKQGLHYKNPEL